MNFSSRISPGPDDVRPSVGVQHVCPDQGAESALRQREDDTGLPLLNGAGNPSRTVAEENLVRTDRQLKAAIGTEFPADAAEWFAVVEFRIQGIRVPAGRKLHRFT